MSVLIIAQAMINGLFLGGVYSLLAVGLTLIYGVMYLFNFAHSEFLMIGMYIGYWAYTIAGIDPYLSVFLAGGILFLIGIIIERALFEPVLKAPLLNQIVMTLGLSSLFIGLAQFFWGAQPRSIILPYSGSSINILGITLNIPRLVAFVVSIVLCVVLYLFLKRTKLGKAIRACSLSRTAAQLMGINVRRIYMITFGIGAALVGIGGVLLTPSFPMKPTIGQNFALSGFVVVVMGTMGNFIGAFISSLIIGVVESIGGIFLGSQLKPVVSMLIFMTVLLLKPQGLFGGKSK